MSRIRQIKPAWFLDKQLRRGTSADAREFYIGLWMLADDDGWLSWDEERIAAELYPYDPERRRERNVAKWSDQLEHLDPARPHLVVYDCGHASVPKMAGHQRIGGTRTTSTHRAHIERCRDARSRLYGQEATSSHGRVVGRERNGTVSNGTDAGAREDAPPAVSEFRRRVDRDTALGARAAS